MKHTFHNNGTCSRSVTFELDGDIVHSVSFNGGCNGNLQGIAHLVEGMQAQEAIKRLKGIRCGMKSTSCPDQLSLALEKALSRQEQK